MMGNAAKVVPIERKSSLLTCSRQACGARIPTVNLTMGCAHNCLYCYARGYRTYPGEDVVEIYTNAVDLLKRELLRKRQKPEAISLSSASDLFQPVPEVLDLTYEFLQEMFARGIGLGFLTKGVIPERHMALLCANADLVRARIGLVSLDDRVLSTFEPGAAPAAVRLAQLKQLTAHGINAQVRIDPILPKVADEEETFDALCRGIQDAGVSELASSVLFLRPRLTQRLRQAAETSEMVAECLAAFRHSQWLALGMEHSSATVLPAQERERILSRLEQAAERYGMSVRRCACKNPDIASGTCAGGGGWRQMQRAGELTLFE